jgi:PKD repeat protein
LTYAWDFGDGTTSNLADPSHAYASSGTFTVSLTVTDSEGASTRATTTATVSSAAPLTASAGSNATITEGQSVTFAGTTTGGTGGDTYQWSFGDGTTAAGSLTPTHAYNADGTYNATLTVTDNTGDKATSSVQVTVNNVAPTVNLNGPYNGTPANAISFTANASVPDSTDTLTYAWNFGDGTTSNLANPSHAYASSGTYNVALTVTDSEGASNTVHTTATVTTNTASNEPLLYSSNLQYVGAFRLPAVADPLQPGNYTYSYGGTALAYDPTRNGLFLVGMPYDQAVSEIAIPQNIVNSADLTTLATAQILQGPVQVLNKLPSNPLAGGTGGELIGGLMVDNGKLIGTAYIGYDASGSAVVSHFALNALNLSTAQVGGLYQVGNLGGGLVGGYMTAIPSEWQSLLGAPDLTGQADINIIGRSSSGPSAFGFDPSKLSSSSVTPSTPYVYYPNSTPLGPYSGPADPLQNDTTQVKGVVFVPGSSTVLFFGSTGTNYAGYGEPSTYGDTQNTAKGPHSLNGQYALQVWAYNANDFAAVKQGTLQPSQVMPYDVWNFTLPTPDTQIGGVAFDAATGRVYVSVIDADNVQAYTDLPLIEVFQVNLNAAGTTSPAAPQVGTLAATPSTQAPGAIAPGTAVTLTAGNVYDIANSGSITQVAFYLAAGSNATFNAGTDQHLGNGSPSTIANANHNWTLTFSTTGLTAGTYTLFARALDSDGQYSNVVSTTITIS